MLDHALCHRRNDQYPSLWGKRILVVEDDPVIAVDYHFQLREVGAMPLAYEPTNKAALDYLSAHAVDAAIVDFRLRDGTSEPVFRSLQCRGIPFIVVSGCTFEMREGADTPFVLSKPVTSRKLWHSLSQALNVRACQHASAI